MSFRYLEYSLPESADMLDANDWLQNITVLAEEFNGRLDRDNLPERSVSASHTVPGTFNTLSSNTRTTDLTLSGNTNQWVDGDGTNTINELTLTTETDGLLRVSWSGSWSWAAYIAYGASPVPNGDGIAWRLVVDGTVVAESPYHSVMRYHDATHLCGVYPLSAGTHTIKVEARLYNWSNGARIMYDCDVETSELIAHLRAR